MFQIFQISLHACVTVSINTGKRGNGKIIEEHNKGV
jgi:hypothetical protein